ncbi:Armadillo/beta-catenin-like repeat [Phytophthora infestans]|uniref:Armadillo/beta-catenin-like repeat n=1 Tax=Phytophthora infestans TaxID=4787 RepID=A0A833S8Y7_PHYIN|nr:Armadillo/beta-catenin-like repeat [Phytophthora infestans]
MDRDNQLPSSNLLDQFVDVLKRYLRFLQLHHSKQLTIRVVRHRVMAYELEELNKCVTDLFVELLDVDASTWREQWKEDYFTHKSVLDVSLSDKNVIFHGLQSPRSQLEALLTFKFEVGKLISLHEKEDISRMKSLIETISAALRVSDTALPSWFAPEDCFKVPSKPFARGDFGFKYNAVQKLVLKRFYIDDSVADEGMWIEIRKEMDILFALRTLIYCLCLVLHTGDNKLEMWRLLYEAAQGLEFIHKEGVVHGKLKLRNILVDAEKQAQLSDYGLTTLQTYCKLSKVYERESASHSCRWRAPECCRQLPTSASDVFSFGMCVVEAVTGVPPLALLSDDEYHYIVRNGGTFPKPDGILDDAWELVLRMTNPDPSKRCKLQYVVEQLKAFADRSRDERAVTCGACNTLLRGNARFCSECKKPTNNCVQHERVFEGNTSSELVIGTCVSDVLNAVRMGSVGDQEQALLTLYPLIFDEGQRKQFYDANGVFELTNLVRNGRTHFIKVSALASLRLIEFDSVLPSNELARLREFSCPATAQECVAIVADLWQGSSRDKAKAALHCACLTDERNISDLREVGVAIPLVTLLSSGDECQKLCAASALGRCAHDIETCEVLARAGAIEPLVALLQGGNSAQKPQSAFALSRLSSSSVCCDSIIDDEAISLFVELLRNGSTRGQLHAACALGNATVIGQDVRTSIVSSGAISPFVMLLEKGTTQQQDQAARTLANLTVDKANRAQITREGGIQPLVKILRVGTTSQKGQAARALANLAIDESNIDVIVQAGAIPSLVGLLEETFGKRDEATRALANLAFKGDSRSAIVKAGAIEPLVGLLRTMECSLKVLAVRALANLALNVESRRLIVDAGAVRFFVERLRDESDYQRSHAVRALANLAIDEEYHSEIVRDGAIPVLVDSRVISGGETN